jgi:hypothetical protein
MTEPDRVEGALGDQALHHGCSGGNDHRFRRELFFQVEPFEDAGNIQTARCGVVDDQVGCT